jgi:CRISPR/Cas system-associated protein Cas5 (RAMP superfamily)
MSMSSDNGPSFQVGEPPTRKSHHHEVPVGIAKKKQKLELREELEKALTAIDKLIASKKYVFKVSMDGLCIGL